MKRTSNNFAKAFGPGLLLAGIAVGTSHLVQSTRAGAAYGLSLIAIIIIAAIAKYPAFRFGATYAAATSHSILDGYKRQGVWATCLYVLVALGTMFAAVPAVTLFTAGLVQAVFGLQTGTLEVCAVILVLSCVLLVFGGYAVLENFIKLVMALLVLCTLAATVMIIPTIQWHRAGSLLPPALDSTNILFIAALLGWMPSSVDISVWHSLWSVAKTKSSGYQPSVKESALDFNIGYIGTIVLAICFLLLGLGTMYDKGVEFDASAAGFAQQLIGLYTQSLGQWSGPIIGLAALLVMLSTLLTGLDGYPRVAVELSRLFAGEEGERKLDDKVIYSVSLLTLATGSFIILGVFLTSLHTFIDVAATLAFLVAPVIAWLNHRSIFSNHVEVSCRPGDGLKLMSLVGVVLMTIFAVYYLYITRVI